MKGGYNIFKTCLCAVLIGACVALFSLTPPGVMLEEEFGLSWLFQLRGPIVPTQEVIIVSIDRHSAEILHLPDDPEKWPRSYYAQLIDKINQQDPSLIAFNMIFGESRDQENDQALADAMATGRNTILSNYLKRSSFQSFDSSNELTFERIIDPLPLFEQAALGSAPFPLPKTASTVKQFWTYKESAGDIATFPVAIFQCFLFKKAYPEIVQLLHQLDLKFTIQLPVSFTQLYESSEVFQAIQAIQTELINDQQALAEFDRLINQADYPDDKKQLLNSWVALLKTSDSLYFNHYGPARTITTIPYYQALVSDFLNPELFNNKIVLVGYSEDIEPEKSQGLYTVFSTINSEIASPIEIAATAVANLIDNTWIKPLHSLYQFLLLFAWTILLFSICKFYTYKIALSVIIVLNLVYLLIAYTWFVTAYVWFPLFIPLMLLMPLLIIFRSITYYQEGRQDHQKMQKAFSFYLPDDVVNSISTDHDVDSMNLYGELMQGVCMATDAGQYTTLSESMNPQSLNELMNNYYGVMFPQVKKYKGMISDVTGDAMFAVWPRAVHEQQDRSNACMAALEISKLIDYFNQSQPCQLPTRIGLHFGDIRLGNVGAAYHYEYRAVGDTVNTATRIEGLNKLLGTQILVSSEMIKGLTGFITREIGSFLLKGKTQPIHIYQLIAEKRGQQQLYDTAVMVDFSKALKLFQQQQWSEALKIWLNIQQSNPGDGPTLFYIQYLKQNTQKLLARPDHSQSSVIKIGNITTPLAFNDETGIE